MALNSSLGSGESKLETVISYLLILGVIVSLFLEVTGGILFYRAYGRLDILLDDKDMVIRGQNFFGFLFQLIRGEQAKNGALQFLTLGIAVLILTPYIRVVASALYFAWKRDIKYTLLTTFVLIVLTISLVLH